MKTHLLQVSLSDSIIFLLLTFGMVASIDFDNKSITL